jgi:hypothetical protein
MQLNEALSLSEGIRKHLSRNGTEVSEKVVRDAVAVGLGEVSWAELRKKMLTPQEVQPSDFRPTPSLEVLGYLSEGHDQAWGRALSSPSAFGKLFIVVADERADAQQAIAASRGVLSMKGRAIECMDFSAYSNRAEVENAFSGVAQSAGDTALLSGMQDVEDYDVLWSLLKSRWQVLVQVDSSEGLARLFARLGVDADDKVVGAMLGLKRDESTGKLQSYLYQRR